MGDTRTPDRPAVGGRTAQSPTAVGEGRADPGDDTPPGPATSAPPRRSQLRAVALPSEHGGWGLTLEPVLLGLIVAHSVAALALGLATVLAFLARTPLKLAAVDARRGRTLERTRLARRVAALELAALHGQSESKRRLRVCSESQLLIATIGADRNSPIC